MSTAGEPVMEDPTKDNSDFSFGERFSMSEMPDESQTDTVAAVPSSRAMPMRYVVKDVGGRKVLCCLEAPNLTVSIQKGLTVSAAAARKSPPGTIYLDGAAQGEPFMEHEKRIYNLDHHEGCVRSFTLATCEQALVMILKGLDLREREWTVYANEPDLDTVLAIWLIFNHVRIGRKESMHMKLLFALVRLQGVIDALGLELREFTALPNDLLRKTQRVIDHLRKDEVQLKKDGLWDEVDYLDFTAAVLHKVDRIIYKSSEFSDFKGIKELARVDLNDNRIVVVVDSDTGIYELEPHLNNLYGNRLGLVALQRSPKNFTLRRMDLFMPGDLEAVYERLNFVDPAVRCRSETNRWGGSAEIGGSPRASGTDLFPREIALACRDALQKPSIRLQSQGLLRATWLAAAVVLPAEICRIFWPPGIWSDRLTGLPAVPDFALAGLTVLLTALALLLPPFRKHWQFGLTVPSGHSWWFLLPAALLFGFLGGIWMPDTSGWRVMDLGKALCLLVAVPLAMELLFRGLIHGFLAQDSRIQHCSSKWFLSWPTVGSAFLYSVYTACRIVLSTGSLEAVFTGWTTGNIFGAFAFGIAVGLVRERSQSVLPPLVFHSLTAAAVALTSGLFG